MMKSVKQAWLATLLAIAVVALLAGCSKKEDQSETPSTAAPAESKAAGTPIDKSTAGSVAGTVKFDGAKPKAAKIDMSQDPACAKGGANMVETIEGDGPALANVFVYVKSGAEKYSFETPTNAVEIDQSGCRYHPHVLGVQTGQTVKIVNSDDTTHNIHPTPQANREWNESQPPKGAAIEKNFAREEIMLPVKCNQHPWMKMYINVVKSPLFAVTDKDGKYEIKDLPPGTYTLAFVHEKLGEQTQQVTIGAKESKTGVDQSFKAQ